MAAASPAAQNVALDLSCRVRTSARSNARPQKIDDDLIITGARRASTSGRDLKLFCVRDSSSWLEA